MKEANLILKQIRNSVILEVDDGDKLLKRLLANNYATFVKKLGDNIRDPKLLKAIRSLTDTASVNTTDMDVECTKLKPTQNEVVMDKSLKYPLTDVASAELYLKGGSVAVAGKRIVTAAGGKYVIDGHHRWSQLFCINPDAKIQSLDLTDVKDPFQALKATQLGIAAQIKKIPTASGGGVNLFKVSEDVLKKYVKDNITDEVIAVFKKYNKGNNPDEIAEYIWGNVQKLNQTSTPVPGAPKRDIMPQTDDAPKWVDTAVNPKKIPESKMKFSSRQKLMKVADKELKNIIREAEGIGKDVDAASKKIKKFSDEGHATEALLELAKLLKSKKHESILKAIQDITEAEETMPYWIEKYRQEVGRELSLLYREKLNNKEVAFIFLAE